MFIFGTRPEAIKLAPVIRRMREDPRFRTVVVVTGQHREMLDQALAAFGLAADHDLDIMRHGQSLTDITARSLEGLSPLVARHRPDVVLVHGDTLTTFAGSLAAFFHQVPVAHVEAGLRTGDRYSPFPEEMNRRLTAALATLHFAPTRQAKWNLLRENVRAEDVFVVGNTVIDALLSQVRTDGSLTHPALAGTGGAHSRMLLVTTHRRENLGEPMRRIFLALNRLCDEFPDIQVVLPLHPNPQVRALAAETLQTGERIRVIEPPDYTAFVNLMARAYLVLTDSGGIQEEAPALGKPVLVLRDVTERPEGVAAGACIPVGTQTEAIVAHARRLLTDPEAYRAASRKVTPYGDGKAAERIVEILWARLRLGAPAREYEWRGA